MYGTVTWAEPTKFKIVIDTSSAFKPMVTIYSDVNPEKLRTGDLVEIEIKKTESK